MFRHFAQRYLPTLDANMRQLVDRVPETPGFNVMLRYPLGWVDADGKPYGEVTGKRIRPVLLLLATEAAGGDWKQAVPAASAVELLHNFSLIHDDIQDDSPTRHGRPTVWRIWGRANAINVGDALFSLAYIALETLTTIDIPAETTMAVWRVFNATVLELTRGQHLDMRFEQQNAVTVDEYLSMISGKSAALVSACAQIGALIATHDAAIAQRYADFGLNLGIAFQIRDDILGIWGDPDVTGKSAATDILSRKKSLPVLYGLSQSAELNDIYQREPFGDAEVEEAAALLNQLGAHEYAQQLETHYYECALQALRRTNPTGDAAEQLIQFVNLLFQRTH